MEEKINLDWRSGLATAIVVTCASVKAKEEEEGSQTAIRIKDWVQNSVSTQNGKTPKRTRQRQKSAGQSQRSISLTRLMQNILSLGIN